MRQKWGFDRLVMVTTTKKLTKTHIVWRVFGVGLVRTSVRCREAAGRLVLVVKKLRSGDRWKTQGYGRMLKRDPQNPRLLSQRSVPYT